MKSEEWMPKLDYLARKLGYEAAARTESAVVALVTAGADYRDIEVTDSEGSVYISLMAYGRDKHGRSMSSGSATIAGDHPAVRNLRPVHKEAHFVGVMMGEDRVSIGGLGIIASEEAASPGACQYRSDPYNKAVCRLDAHGDDVPHEMVPEM